MVIQKVSEEKMGTLKMPPVEESLPTLVDSEASPKDKRKLSVRSIPTIKDKYNTVTTSFFDTIRNQMIKPDSGLTLPRDEDKEDELMKRNLFNTSKTTA